MSVIINLKKDNILFLADDQKNDLYIIQKGSVMVFVQKGSNIIPLAYLGKGEYIGELSFFDNEPRSASIICLEDSEFIKIGAEEMQEKFPSWLKTIGQQLTKKIREDDELIRSKGIRKKNVESIKPLSIEDQTYYYKIVESFKAKNI